ncbi:redoxin family protein [Deltaproteobacteria bacterium TL4]
MFKTWQFWVVIGLIVGLVAMFAFGFTTDPKKVPSPLINKSAPDFEVTHLNGSASIQLSKLRGKPVVLNFWASWCVECRNEAHILEAFHQKYGISGQIQMMGIAIQDTRQKASAFAKQFNKTYFLALEGPKAFSLDYGIYGVPETFFIDRQGIIRYKHLGGVTPKIMEEQIQALLKTP